VKPGRALIVVIAAIAVVAPAMATSPPDQYDKFDESSLEIHDLQTHLIWQRNASSSGYTFDEAIAYCSSLATPSKAWRAPTLKELITIVDEQPVSQSSNGNLVYTTVDLNAFPNTPRAYAWTSTGDAQDGMQAWVVNFANGQTVTLLRTTTLNVRCVYSAP
jgi:hypothetical protein